MKKLIPLVAVIAALPVGTLLAQDMTGIGREHIRSARACESWSRYPEQKGAD